MKKDTPYSPSASTALAIRFLIGRARDRDRNRANLSAITLDHDLTLDHDIDLEHASLRAIALDHDLTLDHDLERTSLRAIALGLNHDRERAFELALNLANDLDRGLIRRDPYRRHDLTRYYPTFDADIGRIRVDPYSRDLARHYPTLDLDSLPDIGCDLSVALLIYLKANKLIVDCLNTDCYVSKQTRQKLLDELLTVPES